MIEKEKVSKVLENFAIAKAAKAKKLKSGKPEDFQYCTEEKALNDYLDGLTQDERIDLYALMDCGRTCNAPKGKITSTVFWNTREEIEIYHKDDAYLSGYLMGKSNLDEYLKCAMSLYEEREFTF